MSLTKYIVVITKTGHGKILDVVGDVRHVWAAETAAGSKILGEFSDLEDANRVLRVGRHDWREINGHSPREYPLGGRK